MAIKPSMGIKATIYSMCVNKFQVNDKQKALLIDCNIETI